MYLKQVGWSLLPDGLTPFGPLPLVPLPSPFEDHRLESREGDRVGFLPFPSAFLFLSFMVPEAARVTFRTLSFREPLRAVSLFAFATATFAISSLSFYRTSLSRSVISPHIEVPISKILIQASSHHTFHSSVAGFFTLLHCILSIQCQSRLQISESHLV